MFKKIIYLNMRIQWNILTFTSMCRNEYGKQIKSTVKQNLFFHPVFLIVKYRSSEMFIHFTWLQKYITNWNLELKHLKLKYHPTKYQYLCEILNLCSEGEVLDLLVPFLRYIRLESFQMFLEHGLLIAQSQPCHLWTISNSLE